MMSCGVNPRRTPACAVSFTASPTRSYTALEGTPGASARSSVTLSSTLAMSIRDPAAGQIVRRQLDCHAVAGRDADIVLPHLSRYMRQQIVAILELYSKLRVGERLGDDTLYRETAVLSWFYCSPHLPSVTLLGSRSVRSFLGHPASSRKCGTRLRPTNCTRFEG